MSNSKILLEDTIMYREAGMIMEGAVNDLSKSCWLNGIFMQSEIKNQNQRIYPRSEIEKACSNAMRTITENKGGIGGELDHPSSLIINTDRICHVIHDLKMMGNDAFGRSEIVPTPMGSIVRTLYEHNMAMGVSSRGTGNLIESRVYDYDFITVDVVTIPSANGARPMMVYEALDSQRMVNEAMNLGEAAIHDARAQEYLVDHVIKFLRSNITQKADRK